MEHFKKPLKRHPKKHIEKYFTKSLKYKFLKGGTIRGVLPEAFQGALHGQLQNAHQELFDGGVVYVPISNPQKDKYLLSILSS